MPPSAANCSAMARSGWQPAATATCCSPAASPLIAGPPSAFSRVTSSEVELVTRIRAAEKATGKVLIDRELTGRTTVRLGGDLANAERQALPLLANDLARKTVALLAEGKW